jgi:CHASE2 domain-containing sensor protein
VAGLADLCRNTTPDSLQPLFVQFSSDWTTVPAEQVRFRSGSKEDGGEEQPIAELKGRLVLLGGTYRDFDRHYTPIGLIPGMLVLANAIQTELDGDAVPAHPKWALFLLEFAAGAVLVVFLHFANFSAGRMLLLGVPAAIGLSVALSVVTFHSFSRITAFVPTLLGILIFELLQHVHHRSIFRVIHAKP